MQGAYGLATDGSWPNLGWYAQHSRTLQELWESVPRQTRQMIAQAWGNDPWSVPLAAWSGTPADLFRIVTLASHLTGERLVRT